MYRRYCKQSLYLDTPTHGFVYGRGLIKLVCSLFLRFSSTTTAVVFSTCRSLIIHFTHKVIVSFLSPMDSKRVYSPHSFLVVAMNLVYKLNGAITFSLRRWAVFVFLFHTISHIDRNRCIFLVWFSSLGLLLA